MTILHFSGRAVHYEQFLSDLSAHILRMMKAETNDPEFVSQRKAYRMFGRRNVERWRYHGKLPFFKRPGKVEYRTADLRFLQRTEQDYLEPLPAK